jgi:hypothetical protein
MLEKTNRVLKKKLGVDDALRKISSILSNEGGVCHTLALPFTVKGIFKQNKNYENPNFTLQK